LSHEITVERERERESKREKEREREKERDKFSRSLFWKSALIMASRYPRERDEVDRKKRRAADTIHFLFP
jgi:hypothetical protein